MRRLGYILALLLALGGTLRADQDWRDNNNGKGFSGFGFGSLSCNNLTPGGATFSTPGTGEIVNGPNPWASQLTWSVDPQSLVHACSDANSGIDDSHPLCSMAELARRVGGSAYANGTSCVVRLLSSMQTTDSAFFAVNGIGSAAGASTPFGRNSFFTIVGVPVVAYSGTMASPSQAAQGAVADNHFTDTGAPAFATSAVIWHDVTAGGYAWPQKDLGSHVYRTSRWVKTFQTGATLANGDTWQMLSLPAINNLSFPYRTDGEGQYQISLVHETSTSIANGSPIRWANVQFDSALSAMATGTMNNCRDFFRTFYSNRPIYVSSGGLMSTATGQTVWDVAEGELLSLPGGSVDYLSMQGIQLEPSSNTLVFGGGGTNTGGNLMFYDDTSALISPQSSNGRFTIQSIGGLGNSGKIVDLGFAADQLSFVSTPSGSMTSDATPFKVMGVSSATLPLLDVNTFTSVVVINDTASFPAPAGCAQFNGNGALSSTGSACGSGSGAVSSVTGTAQRISATPTTGAVVVDTIGGFYSGAVSGGNEDLGSLASGVMEQTTTAGVAAVTTFSATNQRIPFGSGTGGGLTDSANVTYDGSEVNIFSAGTASVNFPFFGTLSAGTSIRFNNAINQGIVKTNGSSLYIGTVSGGADIVYFTNGVGVMDIDATQRFNWGGIVENAAGLTMDEWRNTPPTTASAASLTSVHSWDPITITLSGTTHNTASQGYIYFGAPTLTDASAVTIDRFPTVRIDAPVAAGSVTITEAPALDLGGNVETTAVTAPGTPATGHGVVYEDSASRNICIKNDAGTINHGMQSGSCFASGTWVNQLSDNGSFGCTKPGFSDLSGSLACIQRPAQLGDSTAPAGSCTTTNVAITETSGPQQLTFGAIPDSNPQSTVLIRPTGTNTIVGIAASLIADSVTKHDYFLNEAVDAALYIGEWASTSNDNFIGTGIVIEYPNDFKAGHIKGTMNLISTTGVTSAPIVCALTLNGVAISGGSLSINPSVTANGLYTTGTIATSSASASDTYGLECSTSGALLVGAQYDFSYQEVLTP